MKNIKYLVTLLVVLGTFLSFGSEAIILRIGDVPPEFTLKDLTGKPVSLSQNINSKELILFFWSTWSEKAITEMVRLNDFYIKYKSKGVQVLAINVEEQSLSQEDMTKINDTVKKYGIQFPVLLDHGLITFREYEIIAVPSTFVVTQGRISFELAGLPLVGTEDMFDFMLDKIGELPTRPVVSPYQPKYDAIADFNLGRTFVNRENYVMAELNFKKALSKDPKYVHPYAALSKIYQIQNKNQEAEDILRKGLSVIPDDVMLQSELGYVLIRTNKLQEALSILKVAAQKDIYNPAHYYLGVALSVDGKFQEAVVEFQIAIKNNPFDANAYRLFSFIYEKQGLYDEAAEKSRKAFELLSGFTMVKYFPETARTNS